MTVNRTTLLDLPLPVTGTESNTWGDITNNGLTEYMDIAIAGMSNLTSANFTAGALTIETTEGNSAGTSITATSAQYAGFRVTSLAVNSTITVGNTGTSPARSYRLINADATYNLTFKATGQTGVTLLPGQSAVVAFNGTDYVIVGTVGAGTATDNAVARFDGTTGEILQNSAATIDDTGAATFVGSVNVSGTSASAADLKLYEDTDNGTNYVAFKSPASVASNVTWTLPSADGTNGQALTTNGSGTLAFSSVTTTPGGSTTQVQYNNAGAFAGSSNLTFDGTNLTSGGTVTATKLIPTGNVTAGNGMYLPTTNTLAFSTDGSERMRILSGGKVLINATTDRDKWDNSTIGSNLLQVERSVSGGNSSISIATNPGTSADVFSLLLLGRSRGTANNDYTAVASGDGLGAISFQGADGTEFVEAASIRGHVDGTPGANDMPGRLMFFTTPDGSATSTERMRIDSSGNLLVGTTSAVTGSKLVVDTGDATIYGVRVGRGAGAVSTNTAVGYQALNANTSGTQNVAFGYQSLYANNAAGNPGSFSTAVGYQALLNATGGQNTAVGRMALQALTTGVENTAVGVNALYTATTAGYSVAVGDTALFANTTGSNNTGIGYRALYSNTTASSNTAVGYQSLYNTTTGPGNVAVGYQAGNANQTNSYFVAIGYQAGLNNKASDSLFVGAFAGQANTTGAFNHAVGYAALYNNTTGNYNTAIGYQSLAANTTANSNTAIGYQSLTSNTTGASNTAVGYAALDANTTGQRNVAVGVNALGANTTGEAIVAIGNDALLIATTASASVAIGLEALKNCTTGRDNTAVGYAGLRNLTTGSSNIALNTLNTSGNVAPVFDVTTENNRLVMGHNTITNAYVQVAWTVTSDARDKTNIAAVPHGLAFVNQLNPVSFQFKTSREDDTPNGNKRYGFLAQDILALEGDDPVIIDTEVPEKLKYQGESLVPVLVKAVQELTARLEAAEAEIATLKGN